MNGPKAKQASPLQMEQRRPRVLDTFRLDGKVALVTGGAGLFGRQIAEALAEAGADTYMASRDIAKLEDQAGKFREAGLRVQPLQLDQGSEQSIDVLLRQLIDRAGGVDVLVNNSVSRPMRSWDEPAANFAESMRVNATGLFMMTRAFGNHMAK